MVNTYTSLHNHSDYSSGVLGFSDAICKVEKSLEWCYENGLRGMALTDHQAVSGYVDLEQKYLSLNKERPFQHIFGNEIYLISQEQEIKRKEKGVSSPYYHFLLNVLDEEGLRQMYQLSAMAWKRSYTYKGVLRRPSYYEDLEEIVGVNPGHIVASTACLGGYLPHTILSNEKREGKKFVNWCRQVFGPKNFFLECQPCKKDNREQIIVNKVLWSIHENLDVPIIVTTDSHYMRPENRRTHTTLLRSKSDGVERESEMFYETTYFFTPDELRESLHNIFTDEQIDTLFQTTNGIADRVESISLKKKTRVPGLPKIPDFEVKHYYCFFYEEYPFIQRYAESNNTEEQYFYSKIENSLHTYLQKHPKFNIKDYLAQINIELEQIHGLSEIFQDNMSNYFNVIEKVVDLIWEAGSLVGIGRGSAGAYVINFLLGITGVDPVRKELKEFYPWWRFCSIARSESIFDIDIDIQSFKKENVIQSIKDYFGENRVCQCVTWSRLTAKTAVEKAGRGLNIDLKKLNKIKSLIPVLRGHVYTLDECLNGNKEKGYKKVPSFISAVEEYPDLLEIAMELEGVIISSGVHAAALNILKEDYYYTGSLMKSSNGSIVSSFDLHQAEYCGDLKFDLLSVDALETIDTCLDLLIKNSYIKPLSSKRETFNHYLGFDSLEFDAPDMWKLLNSMPNAFQYDSVAGRKALKELSPSDLTQLTLSNGLMRLAVPSGEQPMAKFLRYRSNLDEWIQDMRNYGLEENEVSLLKELLGRFHGLMIAQETMMSVLMDDRVCGFTLKEADIMRKAVAKKNAKALAESEQTLYIKGEEKGHTKAFLDYLWNVQIEMSKSYAFAFCHAHEYSCVCLQELNLYYKYPKIFWNTAVVITQTKLNNNSDKGNTSSKHGALTRAIYKSKDIGITISPPSINLSEYSFVPNVEQNVVLFGLGAICGINLELVGEIISKRPYTSFDDFYARTTLTKSKIMQLIKAGCFDEFGKSRTWTIKRFFVLLYGDIKTNFTITDIEKMPDNLFPDLQYDILKARNYLCNARFSVQGKDSGKVFCFDKEKDAQSVELFNKFFVLKLNPVKDYWEDDIGQVMFYKKSALDKVCKPYLEQFKEFTQTKEFYSAYRKHIVLQHLQEEIVVKDESLWMFLSCCFYDRKHYLQGVDFSFYDISSFSALPVEPVSFSHGDWAVYQLSLIAGTVIDKNDNKNFITILDRDNDIIECRFNRDTYAFYKAMGEKKEEVSWFSRGQNLILCGYRKGENNFNVKHYKKCIYPYECQRIIGKDNNHLILQSCKTYG